MARNATTFRCGLVRDFYTQGGLAVGAIVARHSTDDEFGIDVMVQMDYSPTSIPNLSALIKVRIREPARV